MTVARTPSAREEAPFSLPRDPWSRTASVCATVGHEASTGLLPGFLAGTLAASPAALGIIEGVADGAAGTARVVGGRLAERAERRRAVNIAGYAGTAVLLGLLSVVATAAQAGLLRVAAWTALGVRTPIRYAQAADRAPRSLYGRAFAVERLARHAGAVAGPLLAAAVVVAVGIRPALALAALPGLLAVAIALRAGRRATPPPPDPFERLSPRTLLGGPAGRLLGAVTIFEMGNVAATLLVLRATLVLDKGGRSAAEATAVALALYALYHLAAALACLPTGAACDRRGPRVPLALGVLGLLVAYVGFAVAPGDALALAGWFVLAGAATGAIETAEHAGVARAAPHALRASAFGYLAATRSGGRLVASVVAGLLWTLVAPAAGLLWAVPLMLASAALLIVAARE